MVSYVLVCRMIERVQGRRIAMEMSRGPHPHGTVAHLVIKAAEGNRKARCLILEEKRDLTKLIEAQAASKRPW